MCNLDINQNTYNENSLAKSADQSLKLKPNNVFINSPSYLANIISTSRMVVMMDYIRNRPRKIILDTNCDNSRMNLMKNKEIQLLSEIVFGNVSLSSKANGFKLHIIKNPSKVIVSKLFNASFQSIYYENKPIGRKISPDSGKNHSSSSNSSQNSTKSCLSSYHSLNSLPVNRQFFKNFEKSHYQNQASDHYCVQAACNGHKTHDKGFFNETDVIYQKSSVMMSVIFTFNIPDEHRAEFEEFIFHYYVLLEIILNKISKLISNNSYNIYNGTVINCWTLSKRWLISLLPQHIAELDSSSLSNNIWNSTNFSATLMNIKNFEHVLEYFDKQKRIHFLAQIMTGVLLTNQNSSLKFLRKLGQMDSVVFPYKHILQNLGINTKSNTFNRIVVKGTIKDKYSDNTSSWKDKLNTSFRYYKKMLNNSSNDFQINLSSSFTSSIKSHFSHYEMTPTYKEINLLTEFIGHLIRPISTIVYRSHVIPNEFVINDSRIELRNDGNTTNEIPLISNGLELDKEILPQINEFFYPNNITDHMVTFITPLQGLLEAETNLCDENLIDQLHEALQQSEITYNNQIIHPDFLIIDTFTSSVTFRDTPILSSSWVEKLLCDFVMLTKAPDYCSVMGDIFFIAALKDFNLKAKLINEYLLDCSESKLDPWIMSQYDVSESDLPLFLSVD